MEVVHTEHRVQTFQLASAEKYMGCGWEGVSIAKRWFGKMTHLQEETLRNAVVDFTALLGKKSNNPA